MGLIHSCCESNNSPKKTKQNTKPPKNSYGYLTPGTTNFAHMLSEDARAVSIVNVSHKTSSYKKVSIEDFVVLKALGKGSFGKVLLVEKIDTKKIYAMKVIRKDFVAKKRQSLHTKTEREILETMNSPFILQLHYAFQTEDKLFLVTDFMNGGELFYHLKKERKFLLSKAKFYIAEIILALEYLHSHNIIYRDLKPENILIGEDGHIKIADFNLSKKGVPEGAKTYTFCGTPEYLAPEILQGKGHNKAVDYWALGTLIYEMLAGYSPFHARDKQQMFANIIKKPIEMKQHFSKETRSLLSGLLAADPAKRLSNMEALKGHEFFADIDWEMVARKEVKPPFIPKLKDETDLRYFDKNVAAEALRDETPDQSDNNPCLSFRGFTYDPITKLEDFLDSDEPSTEDSGNCKGNKVRVWHKLSV